VNNFNTEYFLENVEGESPKLTLKLLGKSKKLSIWKNGVFYV